MPGAFREFLSLSPFPMFSTFDYGELAVSDIDNDGHREDVTAEALRFATDEIIPVAEALTERFLAKAEELALEEGWPQDLAGAIGVAGAPLFLERMFDDANPEEALDDAMRQGRRLVFAELYKNELAQGADRRSAFLKLVEQARENDVRAGDAAMAVPDDWVSAALQAVEAAAGRDLPAEDQVMAGLQSLAESNQSRMHAEVDQALGYV